jgi:hypothetical protein
MAAGNSYVDPTTGATIFKLTSATYPSESAHWGHDYAEGGDEVSLPYNGTTRAILSAKTVPAADPGGSSISRRVSGSAIRAS